MNFGAALRGESTARMQEQIPTPMTCSPNAVDLVPDPRADSAAMAEAADFSP